MTISFGGRIFRQLTFVGLQGFLSKIVNMSMTLCLLTNFVMFQWGVS